MLLSLIIHHLANHKKWNDDDSPVTIQKFKPLPHQASRNVSLLKALNLILWQSLYQECDFQSFHFSVCPLCDGFQMPSTMKCHESFVYRRIEVLIITQRLMASVKYRFTVSTLLIRQKPADKFDYYIADTFIIYNYNNITLNLHLGQII